MFRVALSLFVLTALFLSTAPARAEMPPLIPRKVLFGNAQDRDGDENVHVYAVNVATEKVTDLTPHEGVRSREREADR